MLTIPTGCTVKHVFTASEASVLENIEALYVTYTQCAGDVLEKDLSQVEIDGNKLIVHFSQADTLLFDPQKGAVHFQVRVKYKDGTADKTPVMKCTCDELLKKGVI